MSFRNYISLHRSDGGDDYRGELTISDPYEIESVKSEDQLLHRTLSEIFREHRLTSDQIRELSRSSGHAGEDSMFKLLLEREPALSDIFPKNNELSLLWTAVLCCYQDSAELLVRMGADVYEPYEHQYDFACYSLVRNSSILHALVHMYPSSWNERLIGLILSEHSASYLLEAQDYYDRTVLHCAVRKGRVQATKLFLEKGADVNVKNYVGGQALVFLDAARTPEADELLPLLMKYGAEISTRDILHGNVLHYLAEAPGGEHVDLARVLIEKAGAALDLIHDRCAEPVIHAAARGGKNELIKFLLDQGVNVNTQSGSFEGEFTLHVAVRYKNLAAVRTLLKRGANIEQKTRQHNRTPLHIACYDCSAFRINEESIKLLLSVGADMFAEDCQGETPFDLISQEYPGNPAVENLANIKLMMIKELALKRACMRLPIESKLERRIETSYPEHWKHYQNCHAHIREMKSTRFVETCTIFELLMKCHCQIAALMRNRKFVSKFKLCDLSVFSSYADDIRGAFERAEHYYQSVMLEQEDVINEAVYNILPYLIVRKVAFYALNCEECEIKRIVQASIQEQQ